MGPLPRVPPRLGKANERTVEPAVEWLTISMGSTRHFRSILLFRDGDASPRGFGPWASH